MVWAVQSTLLLGVACLACSLLRKSASARLIICRSALVGTLALFLVLPWSYYRSQPVVPISVGRIHPEAIEMPIGSSPLQSKASPAEPTPGEPVHVPTTIAANEPSEPKTVNLATFIAGAWFFGVIGLSAWLALGLGRLRHLSSKTTVEAAGPLLDSVRAASEAFNCKTPEVRVGKGITSPFVAGMMRPTLYVPQGWAENQSPDCLDAVCRHEVAHIAAYDLRWNLINRLAAIVFWPQPLIWLIGKFSAAASEEVCDAKVLASGCSPEEYATTLLDLRQSLRTGRPAMSLGIGAVSIRSGFGRRIESIMNYRKGMGLLSRKRAMLAMGAVAIISLATTLCAMPKHSGQTGSKIFNPFVPVSGKISVKLVTPNGKLGKAFAGIVFDDLHGDSQWVQADIVDGVVYSDLSPYSSNVRATLVAIVPGFGISFRRIWPVEKPVTELKIQPAVRLAGSVVTPDGSPEANAQVEVRLLRCPGDSKDRMEYLLPNRDLKALLGTWTNSQGKFEIPNLPKGGAVEFDFVDPKYASCQDGAAYFNETKLSTSPISVAPVVHLRRAAVFTGRVTRDGKPVAGIRIGAQGNFETGGDPGLWGDAITNANGIYEMKRMYPGHYNVVFDEARMNGEVTAVAHENVNAEEGKRVTGLDFNLVSGAAIKGKITDASGLPLAGAAISVYGPGHPQTSAWVQSATSGRDGTYTLHVPAGKQYVYLSNVGEGKDQQAKTLHVENGTTTVQDFQIN